MRSDWLTVRRGGAFLRCFTAALRRSPLIISSSEFPHDPPIQKLREKGSLWFQDVDSSLAGPSHVDSSPVGLSHVDSGSVRLSQKWIT